MPRELTAASLGGLPIQLNPTARDYRTIRSHLITLITQLTSEWTDFSAADPGVTILEAMSYLGDILSYQSDRVQNESYLITAQQRAAVIQLLRLIGYELQPRSGASANLVVVTSQPGVVLPAGPSWYVESVPSSITPALRFELLNPVTLPVPGVYTITEEPGLVAVHGETITSELVGQSTGQPNQRFNLFQTPLVLNPDGSSPLRIWVGITEWSPSGTDSSGKSFLGNEPDDQVYRWEVDEAGRVLIRFGDGVNGAIPPSGEQITATYRIGGGAIGNQVGRNALNTYPTIVGLDSVTNPDQPSGGSDAETLEHAKKYGPLSLRTLDRAVTLEDYETLALQLPGGGVKAAKADHTSSIEVTVYIMAEGSNPIPSGTWYPELDTGTGLIGAVGRWLTEKKCAPSKLQVKPPTVVRPRFEADIYVLPNVLRNDVRYEVEKNLAEYFLGLLEDFGRGVPLSRLIQIIENTRGVDWLNALAFHRFPEGRFRRGYEAAFTNGLVTVSEIKTTVEYDHYTIKWVGPNQFKLVGEAHGVILDASGVEEVFVANAEHALSLYPLSTEPIYADQVPQFTLEVDVDPAYLPRRGDEWEFGVDNYLGNVAVKPFEVLYATILNGEQLDSLEFNLRFGGGIG